MLVWSLSYWAESVYSVKPYEENETLRHVTVNWNYHRMRICTSTSFIPARKMISQSMSLMIFLFISSTQLPETFGKPLMRRPRQVLYQSEWNQPPLITLTPPTFLPFLFSIQNYNIPSNNAEQPVNIVDQSNWDIWTGDSFGIISGSWSATTQFPILPNWAHCGPKTAERINNKPSSFDSLIEESTNGPNL